jgi:hypothetical protein
LTETGSFLLCIGGMRTKPEPPTPNPESELVKCAACGRALRLHETKLGRVFGWRFDAECPKGHCAARV